MILERQKELGIVPPNTKLTERIDEIPSPAWVVAESPTGPGTLLRHDDIHQEAC